DSTLIVIGFATTTLNTAAASNVSTAVDGGTNVENALASRVPTVATLAALQAVSTTGLVDGSSKRDMDGRSSAGDGGAGRFVWRSGNQSANVAADEVGSGLGNGGIWIAPSSDLTGASGAWERDTGRIAFANWYFGASTGQDLTSVIQLASDNNVNLYLMPQEHRVDGTITLKEGHTIQGGGAGGLFLNAPTTATGTILNKPATGVDGPIIILKSSSTVKGIQFRHLKVNGATTGIVRLGTGAENCVYNALLDCSIYGHFTNDLTRANTCFGLYTAAGTISTVVYWNRISNVQITNCDVGVSYNAQANANHASNVVVKEARIGFWLDGGATECIDNSFSGIGVYNGQLFTPDAICFKMDNICKFNTFYGNTEAFGKAFDIDAQSVNNIFSGAFNEIVDSSVGDGNTLQGINETQQQGRVRQTNSLTGESAYILKSSRYIPTGGFQTIAEYLSTDAQASGVGAGVGLGGAFTNAGLLTVFAQIAGVKENNTSGDFGGEMELSVRPQGLPMTPVVRLGLNTQRPATDATIDSGTTSFRWKDINTMRVRTHPVTVGNLPSASGIAGTRAFVTDATTTTFASIVAGGGSNGVPVYSDGTNWRIG
ncbi:hypothetical protein, partial [Zhongshania sp.]|uniref:hypothetical protein n=1 Tax=Zhongshania sp. TaxID=1971902 RepID=UPI0035634148